MGTWKEREWGLCEGDGERNWFLCVDDGKMRLLLLVLLVLLTRSVVVGIMGRASHGGADNGNCSCSIDLNYWVTVIVHRSLFVLAVYSMLDVNHTDRLRTSAGTKLLWHPCFESNCVRCRGGERPGRTSAAW
jgi:hypothetical protein